MDILQSINNLQRNVVLALNIHHTVSSTAQIGPIQIHYHVIMYTLPLHTKTYVAYWSSFQLAILINKDGLDDIDLVLESQVCAFFARCVVCPGRMLR